MIGGEREGDRQEKVRMKRKGVMCQFCVRLNNCQKCVCFRWFRLQLFFFHCSNLTHKLLCTPFIFHMSIILNHWKKLFSFIIGSKDVRTSIKIHNITTLQYYWLIDCTTVVRLNFDGVHMSKTIVIRTQCCKPCRIHMYLMID